MNYSTGKPEDRCIIAGVGSGLCFTSRGILHIPQRLQFDDKGQCQRYGHGAENLQQVDAMVLRFALINAHYRSPIDMNEVLLKDAERNYNRVLECYINALKGMVTE